MPSTPDVSVIVPTYNRAEFLPCCLDSLFCQTVPASEIIVVNDGSDAPTDEVLSRYDRRITVINKSNGGKSSAVNMALVVAKGDLIWILDDDDEAVPDALERSIESLKRAQDCAFGYSTKYVCATRPDRGMGPVVGVTKVPARYDRSFAIRLMRKNFLGAASLIVRRQAYREVGPFDESLIRSQDYEMAVRLALRYRGIRVDGGPTFRHRTHDGDRGPALERFSASDRPSVWQKYTQRFMRDLYERLPLSRYGPADEMTPQQAAVATLTRARIMASHGLFDLVMADLRFLRTTQAGTALPSDAWEIGRHVVRHFIGEGGSVSELKDVLSGGPQPVRDLFRSMRRHCVPAVVWQTVPNPIQRRVRQAVSLFANGIE
ncbi:MAG: glycosyltransferase family A protein [Rhodothermales bacterium]|nr:glycosyltransferase family A protein [Rhodothermales bacterium]